MDKKKLPPIDSSGGGKQNLDPKNMTLIQRSRFQAYEEPPKEIQDACYHVRKRLRELKKQSRSLHKNIPHELEIEKDKHIRIIGQLKAAEARNRLRSMRLHYEFNKAQEISHLIACQPVALKAVRFEALVAPSCDVKDKPDLLDKFEKQRVDALLEDYLGLLINRIV